MPPTDTARRLRLLREFASLSQTELGIELFGLEKPDNARSRVDSRERGTVQIDEADRKQWERICSTRILEKARDLEIIPQAVANRLITDLK